MKIIKLSIEQPLYDDPYYSAWGDQFWYVDEDYPMDDELIQQILDNIPIEEEVDKYGFEEGRTNINRISEYLINEGIKKLEFNFSKSIERISYE